MTVYQFPEPPCWIGMDALISIWMDIVMDDMDNSGECLTDDTQCLIGTRMALETIWKSS